MSAKETYFDVSIDGKKSGWSHNALRIHAPTGEVFVSQKCVVKCAHWIAVLQMSRYTVFHEGRRRAVYYALKDLKAEVPESSKYWDALEVKAARVDAKKESK